MRIISCILILCFTFSATNAQDSIRKKAAEEVKPVFYIGPKLGLNIIPTYKSEAFGQTYHLGINSGIATKVVLNKHFSISPEVLYTVKKKTYSFSSTESLFANFNSGFTGGLIDSAILNTVSGFLNDTVYSNTVGAVSLSYIELPLLATYHIGSFDFSAGPYFAFLMRAASKESLTQESALLDIFLPLIDSVQLIGPLVNTLVTSQFPGYKSPQLKESSDKSLFRKFDYGFLVDIGYRLNDNFKLNMRYSLGSLNYRYIPLAKHDVNKSVQFSLTYLVGIKPKTKTAAVYDLSPIPVK